MSGGKIEGKITKEIFDQYKFSSYPNEEISSLAGQICVANLIQAFKGIYDFQQIINAIGNAKSPNEVSLIVRNNLPL